MANYNMVLTSEQLNNLSRVIKLYKKREITFNAVMIHCYCTLAGCNSSHNFFQKFIEFQFGLTGITAYNMIMGDFTPSKVFQDKIINLIGDRLKGGVIVFQT